MPIKRVYRDWREPALPEAAGYLLERFRRGTCLDLEDVVVVFPGAAAGRRFLEILVEQSEERSLALVPPEIVTPHSLPELLYDPTKPFADDLTQQLAWVHAMKTVGADVLSRVVPEPPPEEDFPAWLTLGGVLSRLHRDLAADRLDFADVAAEGESVAGFDESPRWDALRTLQERYLRTLDELKLWDRQTARLFAIKHRECGTEKEIVLVATVDLNRTMRSMLDQVADRVTTIVFGPPGREADFDAHGCLDPDAWQVPPRVPEPEQTTVADRSSDQADAAVRAVAAFDGKFAADEITLGVPDESLVPYLEQRFEEAGTRVRYGPGRTVTETGPYRLLEALGVFLQDGRTRSFAAWLRHPDLERWLKRTGVADGWLDAFDTLVGTHFPGRAAALSKFAERNEKAAAFVPAWQAIDGLLAPWKRPPQPLGDWAAAVTETLLAVYGDGERDLDRDSDREIVRACEALRDAASELSAVPASLAPRVPAGEAIRLVLAKSASGTIPPVLDEPAIEAVGWLELPLDDAPACVVTGFNEGFVPSLRDADPFLPNELRRRLHLEDSHRRLARDAYALGVLTASRSTPGRAFHVIAGRRNAANDPLLPSRLLFETDDDASLPQRTLQLLKPPPSTGKRLRVAGSLVPGRETSAFAIPTLPQLVAEETESFRVTEFRDFLACPYRYVLKHRLRLQGRDDSAEELDPATFGTVLHDVLKAFGNDEEARDFGDADQLRRVLDSLLDRYARRKFGSEPLPAVLVQLEQVRMRLHAFAAWQAKWAADGWKIAYVEESFGNRDGSGREACEFVVDDRCVLLRGTVDRVDVHEASGRVAVFDYKTGDSGTKPEKTHRKRDEWIDLQLPLYRHLIAALDLPGNVQLGYVVLPKSLKHTGHLIAEWTDDDLADADETAREVVRRIRTGDVAGPVQPPPPFSEEFAAICQDLAHGSAGTSDANAEGEG